MARGGSRKGAGRPSGTGTHGEKTKPLRIPESMLASVVEFVAQRGYKLPLYSSHVQAGGPSAADDYVEDVVDLNEMLVFRPAQTFMVRATGESMRNAGIFSGDTLIVDKSMPVANGKIVVAAIDGQLTVKRFHKEGNAVLLLPENPDFEPIVMEEHSDLTIWGVVTSVIRQI